MTEEDTKGEAAPTLTLPGIALHTLAPEFSAEYHDVYLKALTKAIEDQPRMRNIALTGAYGTGKSSILAEVARQYQDRVVEISLSSVGDAADDDAETASTEGPGDQTNLIQKEIVKQLLYKEQPSRTSGSRFRRVSRFRWWPAMVAAGLVALLTTGFVWLSGAGRNLEAVAGPDRLAGVIAYLLLWIATTAAVFGLMRFTHGRVTLEKLTAGPAAVSLTSESSSYFDKYLDEIVYYFELSGRDIVVLEDLDRFDNVRIFEALRALNTLLNGSEQIRNRTRRGASKTQAPDIRFIYALRDSVFEKLGAIDDGEPVDEAQREIERANRTKFFDLVIPVVPFITHRNARDLMTEAMKGTAVSDDLVDLAAGHIADMRLIWNLRNEYDIFSRRLLADDNSIPGLDPDRLFAILLYKSIHMSDFEDIRLGRSQLDKLHARWRALVSQSLASKTAELTELQRELAAPVAVARASARLGARLADVAAGLNKGRGDGAGTTQVSLLGVAKTEAEQREPQFWSTVIQEQVPITITLGYGWSPLAVEVLPTALSQVLDVDIDAEGWDDSDRPQIESDIAACKRSIEFLMHHTWQDASTSQRLSGKDEQGSPETFRACVDRLLDSELARQLVRRGYINDYFTLYISQYYGQHLRRDALNFIVHAIDKNEPDFTYPLESADVDAILAERGDGVLHERCALNVSILDHLLGNSTPLAGRIVAQLADEQPRKHAFLDVYLAHGNQKRLLIEQLSPLIADLFTYLVEAPVDEQTRRDLLDAALTHWTDDTEYQLGDSVREYIEQQYPNIPILAAEPAQSAEAVARAVQLLAKARARLDDLASLNPAARSEAVKRHTYRITEHNLQTAAGSADIALDTLLAGSASAYTYVLAHPGEYLGILRASATTICSINRPEHFARIVSDSADAANPEDLAAILESASPDCVVADLNDVLQKAWTQLVATQRATPSFGNVTNYMHAHSLDEPLAHLLESRGAISGADAATAEDRQQLALQILAARAVLPDPALRVRLVEGLTLASPITASAVEAEPGRLLGLLIKAGIIEDDAEAFATAWTADWPTLEFAIANSDNFANFVTSDILRADDLEAAFSSVLIPDTVKDALIENLVDYGDDATRSGLEAAAQYAAQGHLELDRDQLEVLAAGKVSSGIMVRLLAAAPALRLSELRATLREIGGDYATIADVGHGRPKLPDDEPHRAILDRLQAGGIVSQYRTELGGLRVTLKHQES